MEKTEKKNTVLLPILVSCLLVGAGAFFGGMKFAEAKSPANRLGNFQNLSAEERQQRFQQGGGAGSMGRRLGGQMGGTNFVSGEVLSKDDKSVTLKLIDGGSKILFLSSSTTVMMSSAGSLNDVKVGETISANGSSNSDGSITAQSLQIRPKMMGGIPAQP